MSILIAPGTSRTASYVTRALLSSPSPPIRLLAHSPASKSSLEDVYRDASVSVIVSDLLHKPALEKAMEGVNIVFYNPPVNEQEVQMGKTVVDAALAAGVKHFVFCSVLHPYLSRLIHHRTKLDVEEYLFESGINYTILQPTHLMQNVPVMDVLNTGRISIPWKPSILQGFLDLDDLGSATASIILSPEKHVNARYELVGENATYDEVAQIFTEYSTPLNGKAVACVQIEKAAALEGFERVGRIRDRWTRDAMYRMMVHYDERGIPGNCNTLRWLLEREPTTWPTLIEREMNKVIQA